MRKRLFWALAFIPFLLFCSKKDKNDPPIPADTWYEVTPLTGGSSITFHEDFSFTLTNRRVSAVVTYKYGYQLENGKMKLIPPLQDSYAYPGLVTFRFTSSGELIIDNFRPNLWQDAEAIRLKKH